LFKDVGKSNSKCKTLQQWAKVKSPNI